MNRPRTPSSSRLMLMMALVLLATGLAAASTEGTPPAQAAPDAEPVAAPAPDAAAPPLANQQQMSFAFDEFFKVGLDLDKPLTVHNLTLKRDTMELTLTDGTVYLMQPIGGMVAGAYFTGSGTIKVTIPNAIDRKLLKESYGRTEFDEAIGEAVLRFDDGTEKEILAAAKPGVRGPVDPSVTWADRQKIDYNSTQTQMDFVENALNGFKWASFFSVEIHTADGKNWYAFWHSGSDRIEDGLVHERAMGSAGKRWYESLSMFHRPEDYDAKGNYDLMPASDDKDTAALRHVDMEIDIPNTKSLTIDSTVTVEALHDGLRAVRFDLLNNLGDAWYEKGRTVTVEQVTDTAGNPLPYVHGCNDLLVLLPRPLTRGEKAVVRVKATENTIIELTDKSYWIYTDTPWFPKLGYGGGRYTFDWTFKVAKPMRAASSGDLVKEWTEGDLNCSEYRTDVPSSLASFIFGELKPTDGAYKREASGSGDVALRLYTVYGGAFHFKGKPENILYNVEQGLKTYESAFGPYAYKELDIAEMAPQVSFAQSPAGILLLPSGVAGTSGGGGETDQLIFHELAHQWWGQNVGEVGREDSWISESWAEYSSGLITEAIDKKKFHTMLENWRKKAFETDKWGTIATAYRSDSIEYPWARTNLLYSKGPCVIHMLRTWMGWDKFSKYVGTIQSKYKGSEINTDTLAREASAVLGYDMFPFFDQWVREKGIPRVHWSWSAAPDTDGKQIVTIKTRQEDVENAKILMVPISFDFGGPAPTVVQKPILKAEAEIKLKVPVVPKAVRMDEDESQLAVFIDDGKKK
jgi:aminopeptidase N